MMYHAHIKAEMSVRVSPIPQPPENPFGLAAIVIKYMPAKAQTKPAIENGEGFFRKNKIEINGINRFWKEVMKAVFSGVENIIPPVCKSPPANKSTPNTDAAPRDFHEKCFRYFKKHKRTTRPARRLRSAINVIKSTSCKRYSVVIKEDPHSKVVKSNKISDL